MKLAVIGGREVTAGFALAGTADVRVCREEGDAEKALKEYAHREDVGVILIEKCHAEKIRDDMAILMQIRDPYPLIVTIPSYNGEREG